MKRTIKIYLENGTENKLIAKAREKGFVGRGAISHYIQMIAEQPVIFLDENAKVMLRALDLK